MKVGIIVYSATGNTLSVAQELERRLADDGHETGLERIRAENDDPESEAPVRLTELPDPSAYDAVVLAAPVRAFTLTNAMKAYFKTRPRLEHKRVLCFVTQHFKHAFLGGNRALRVMRRASAELGARVEAGAVVNWSGERRTEQIRALIEGFSRRLA